MCKIISLDDWVGDESIWTDQMGGGYRERGKEREFQNINQTMNSLTMFNLLSNFVANSGHLSRFLNFDSE